MLEIRPVSFMEIIGASNSPELLKAYSEDCAMADYDPQVQIYQKVEEMGTFKCFGAYLAEELIGFISLIFVVMPHNGKRVATVESLFVAPHRRTLGADDLLMSAAEDLAKSLDCVFLAYTARIGSALDKVLSRRTGCAATHVNYTRWL